MTTPDPRLSPARATPYLTVIPDRLPKQKVHASLGHAKNAINYRDQWRTGIPSDCVIFEWKDDAWQVLYEIPKGTHGGDMPWNKEN
jgi:hypothetical protein